MQTITSQHSATRSVESIARALVAGIVRESGATVPVRLYGDLPRDGYMVGGVVPHLVVDPLMFDWDRLEHWIRDALARESFAYFGSWRGPDGRLYFDACDLIADKTDALVIGYARGEIAVYDLARGRDLYCESLSPIEHMEGN